ncbi:MAG: ATP-dependent DNA helicase RecG [Synergistaceae bacterium]|nr:ATP-dependent DNA helicase RecG [Synergistaceae bacterium]
MTVSDPFSELISTQYGVGPKRTKQLANLEITTVGDLLWFFPRKYVDRRNVVSISKLVLESPSVLEVTVNSIKRRRLQKPGLELVTAELSDDTGTILATWFNRKGLEYILKEGTAIIIYGIPSFRGNNLEISNPDFAVIKNESDKLNFCGIVPQYPSTAGLHIRWFRNFVASQVKKNISFIEETLPKFIIKKRSFVSLSEAIETMHRPFSPEQWKEARRRLAYDEFFTIQITMALRRKKIKDLNTSPIIVPKGKIYKNFRKELDFKLTSSQEKVLSEIFGDTSKNIPMSRLLQGDVGSGKTIVAIGLAAAATDALVQTAILAPTEVLADQLYSQMTKYLSSRGVSVVLLKGALTVSEKRKALASIKNGSALVVVGTQSLLEESVKFKNLGVVIIDEQHRFGVRQRAILLKRKKVPHVLLMSATPIPRTLTMCLFGDLDISVLKEKPVGRKKIETRIIGMAQINVLLDFIAKEVQNSGRIYWICPRVEDQTDSDIASSKSRFEFLKKNLGQIKIGLLHGRMESNEKEETLLKFRKGDMKILVSTTVIEVGVDVPEASVIVIESPEYFGLSQLHQLRGRVGRGERRGVCVLLASLEESALDRLNIMLKTDDGFEISEADLSFRGSGEVDGISQHGATNFRVANLFKDTELLLEAREDAYELVNRDPSLSEMPALIKKIKLNSDEIIGIG